MGTGLILAKSISSQLMAATLGGAAIAPLAREIFLVETWMAGLAFENRRAAAEKLPDGERLTLLRRPDNPHDTLAIEVHAPDGAMLGFVPRAHNAVPARLMDAGKLLFARLRRESLERSGVGLALYLRDL